MLLKVISYFTIIFLFFGCASKNGLVNPTSDKSLYKFNKIIKDRNCEIHTVEGNLILAQNLEVKTDSTFWEDLETGKLVSESNEKLDKIVFEISQKEATMNGFITGLGFGIFISPVVSLLAAEPFYNLGEDEWNFFNYADDVPIILATGFAVTLATGTLIGYINGKVSDRKITFTFER